MRGGRLPSGTLTEWRVRWGPNVRRGLCLSACRWSRTVIQLQLQLQKIIMRRNGDVGSRYRKWASAVRFRFRLEEKKPCATGRHTKSKINMRHRRAVAHVKYIPCERVRVSNLHSATRRRTPHARQSHEKTHPARTAVSFLPGFCGRARVQRAEQPIICVGLSERCVGVGYIRPTAAARCRWPMDERRCRVPPGPAPHT